MDLTFLVGGGILASVIIQTLKALLGKVEGRWGSLVTLLVLLAASFGIAGLGAAFKLLPQQIIDATLAVFATAVVVYETLYKAIYVNGIKDAT